MDLGINVAMIGDTRTGLIDLVNACAAAGVLDLRVTAGRDFETATLRAICKAAKANKQRLYLLPEQVGEGPEQAQVIAELLRDPKVLLKFYQRLLGAADVDVVRGIGFVDRFYLALQSHDWVKLAVPVPEMVAAINAVVALIRKFGPVKVVLPTLQRDLAGWEVAQRVDFDVFDVEHFRRREEAVHVQDVHAEKPIWIGAAGVTGGHLYPSVQARWLERYVQAAQGRVEVIYLYSRRGVKNFDWSHLVKRLAHVQGDAGESQEGVISATDSKPGSG